ncbi:MAG TPA: hypothetical protein VJI68_00230 [Candidatus Nanoarchaeia archaeon]|nr:hypothetical protein [Candidatus Nanoarchaeia archaeon]
MGEVINLDFSTNNHWFGMSKPKPQPTEENQLSKYAAAITAFREYAKQQDLGEVVDNEGENVYEDMCRRKIGNFAHGWHHNLSTPSRNSPTLSARVEAFKEANLRTYGSIVINVEGPSDLIQKIKYATENAPDLPLEETMALGRKFTATKSECYGYCRRD